MKVEIVNKSNNPLPKYETIRSAGMDLRAYIETPKNGEFIKYKGENFYIDVRDDNSLAIVIQPGGRVLIPTGLHMAIPEGYELQIRPRSGLALKQGISLVNSPGTIDSDYRGDIGAIVINHGSDSLLIANGDRICQAVLSKVEQLEPVEVTDLDKTSRGEGGFGHTGR